MNKLFNTNKMSIVFSERRVKVVPTCITLQEFNKIVNRNKI